MTQKKLTEPETYETPLERLLSFLRVPHKIYRSIYIAVIERRLSTPLLQNDANMAFLAREVGIEPALMLEKIRSMVRMKWIELEEVGKRHSNQIFVISPIWRYKPGIDKAKFAIALQEYRAAIVKDKEHQMNTQEIYDLMNSVCQHTEEKIDSELCKMARFPECQTCSHRRRDNE
jgi:hypothetical protein